MTPVEHVRSVDEATRTLVLDLAARIEAEDGAPPLSDQTRAQLGSTSVTHLVARDGDDVAGYGQVDDETLEVAALPPAVPALLDAARAAGARLVWSHGRHARLQPVLAERGFVRIRELHQLRRPATDLPDPPALADGVTVRTFVPGRDDAAWLAVNAAAFADHPEQGRWTQADLDARIAEDWFDPDGFLLAERDGHLLGFHWTKVHPGGLGEVYVLGVSPDAQGLGLGRALLIRGLRLLVERGCEQLLLYVDGDNAGALRLYERDGFGSYDLDVQWQAPSRASL